MAGQFHLQMIGRYKHPTKIFWDKEPTRLKKLLNKTRQNTQEAVSNKWIKTQGTQESQKEGRIDYDTAR